MRRVVISVLLLVSLCGSLQAPTKRVLIDAFHSQEEVKPEVNTVALTKVLPEYFFEVKREKLTEDLLENYDVVVLYQPYKVLEDSEIEAVKEFVTRGGGLLMCGTQDVGWNDDSRSTYNKLGSVFGIIFASNAVDDPTDKAGCYCTPIIRNIVPHPTTEGITQIVMYRPCSLRVSGNALILAKGDNDTRTVGADKLEGEDIIVVAVSEYERGRVIALGTHTVFDDSFINEPDNQAFSVNCFKWVSEQATPKGSSQETVYAIAAIIVVLVAAVTVSKLYRRTKKKEN